MGSEPGSGRIASLDILRLLACAAVIVVHGQHLMPLSYRWVGEWAARWLLAHLAVAVFFVLSGFVITRILVKGRQSGEPLGHFLARRSARIFPPYFLLIGGGAALSVLWPAWCVGRSIHWTQWIYAYNIAQGTDPSLTGALWPHTWSLSVEEQFYVFWPFAVYGLTRAGIRNAALAIIPVPVVLMLLLGRDAGPFLHMATSNFMYLCAGVLMAHWEPQTRSPRAWIVGAAMIVLGALFYRKLMPFTGWAIALQWAWIARVAIASGVVLVALSALEPMLTGHGRWRRWLTEWGVMSYGLYLYHMAGNQTAVQFRAYLGWWTFPAAVACTAAITYTSYRLLERPLIQWAGRRFRGRQPAAVAMPAAA